MQIKITSKNGIKLKTKDKYCTDDINILVDESLLGGGGSVKKLFTLMKDISSMFQKNANIIDLTGYIDYNDTENVEYMDATFNSCANLTTLPSLNTNNVKTMRQTFAYSKKITRVDISHYNLASERYANGTFIYCHSLKELIIRSFGETYIVQQNFLEYCYHIVGTIDSTYNPNGDKDGYIYVPRNMIDTLKNATNWSTYADQMRILEEYTVDGTTTGKLDESKI